MFRASVPLVSIALLWWWMTTAEAANVKYKDPRQPLQVRVNDLMSRMTLEEKIGQMVQIDRTVATPEIVKNYSIGKKRIFPSFYFGFFAVNHTNWFSSVRMLMKGASTLSHLLL